MRRRKLEREDSEESSGGGKEVERDESACRGRRYRGWVDTRRGKFGGG